MGPQNIGRGFSGENDGNPKWMVTKKVATVFFSREISWNLEDILFSTVILGVEPQLWVEYGD